MKPITLLLVEGALDRIFYEGYIVKALGGKEVGGSEAMPEALKNVLLASEVMQRIGIKVFELYDGLVVLAGCGGFDNSRTMLRELLKRRDELVRGGLRKIVLVGDADKDVKGSVQGTVSSILGRRCEWHGPFIRVEAKGGVLCIAGVAQGLSGGGKTGQLEDLIEDLAVKAHAQLKCVVEAVEEAWEERLNSKQRVAVFAALLAEDQSKARLTAELWARAGDREIEQLRRMVRELEDVLKSDCPFDQP